MENIARTINISGQLCGKSDVAEGTSEQLQNKYGITQADARVLFGGSITCGDILAKAMKEKIAKTYGIVGGTGHTTETLRRKMHKEFPDIETDNLPEAQVFARYLREL